MLTSLARAIAVTLVSSALVTAIMMPTGTVSVNTEMSVPHHKGPVALVPKNHNYDVFEEIQFEVPPTTATAEEMLLFSARLSHMCIFAVHNETTVSDAVRLDTCLMEKDAQKGGRNDQRQSWD
ncbi:hypothetical protein K503DRAFT_869051 [Rhizopogon vinicolor AM-OR11-026]|uniref:Uncharacterized protein n=1 Tax=Rhizopogon vinicolor AM-OR11-026 TaxID=1314800 RepID=A0A1B7MNR4_9AGAM|nr:hypothetical protein K503DRAFT_869051 [Rhizopogon vinicolor AM-OR11-026]